MRKTTLLAAILAAVVMTTAACDSRGPCSTTLSGVTSCADDPPPQKPSSIVIEPTGATLVVGQHQAFEVRGGKRPYHAHVAGCLGAATTCEPSWLSGGNLPFDEIFVLAWTGRTIVVIFLDASLQPSQVQLKVWGNNGYGHESKNTTVVVPLQLVY